MKKLALATATSLLFSLNASAALYDRGNGMIYDSAQNITWLQDANYAKTSGYDADGRMNWLEANTWASNLNYGGYDDWRLPSSRLLKLGNPCESFDGSCDIGYNNITSELGYMYHVNLDNLSIRDTNNILQSGYGLLHATAQDAADGHTINFLNTINSNYWTNDTYIPDWHWQFLGWAWRFNAYDGLQDGFYQGSYYSAWAVRDGDVTAVPVPTAAWLFGSGLIGLAATARRRKAR